MGKIFSQVAKPRIPAPSDGIQVNYCKNPKCNNYGRPAKPKVSRGKVAAGKKRVTDVYTVNASGWDMPVLHCKECGESPPMKSNVGIAQELDRFKSLLAETDNGCQNPECENFGVSLRARKRYQKFGATASGDPRYRCKACGKTFSVGPASRRHRRSEKNKLMVKRNMKTMKQIGQYKDLWLEHPYPNKSEPEKMVSYQTDLGDYDEDLVADMYMRASMAGIDRFFMQARRRSSYLERGIHTSSRSGGVWHGYAPYDPRMIGKSLDMLRFYYNYVHVGKNKETPAMKLGLADGPVKVEDLLYE